MEDNFYTTSEVAKKLKVSRVQVYRWIKSKQLKVHRFGRTALRISKEDLQEFLKNHKK